MCGITGWVSYRRNLAVHRRILVAMTKTMARRGPDAEGVWTDRHVGLGHRRLSIIDLAGGTQPMLAEEDGKVIASLTYSGEIYNFPELREELQGLGHRFKTRSDTEVVLHAYLEWGNGFVDRLNGMYAFAIWDARIEELILVRDRMGVKPLYYFETADGVLFGSEQKAILAHPEVPCRIDADGLRDIIEFVKVPGRAVFAGMNEVCPGDIVRVNRNGVHKRTYWKLEAREHEDDQPTTVRKVRGLLEDIMQRQIISDVPLCTLLSGGLDSSLVTALAAKALARQGADPVRSFSVDFVDHGNGFIKDGFRESSDTPFVREVVRHIGSRHEEIVLDSGALMDPQLRSAALRGFDYPPAYFGDMCTSLYLLFEAVRRNSTVALSGEAADELFGGYAWFHNSDAIEADTFPWAASPQSFLFDSKGLLDPALLKKLRIEEFRQDSYIEAKAECPVLAGESRSERRHREISYLHLARFVRTLLDRKDRMSMAVGLEVRVPFCDHRLVEYVFNVPWRMKTFDGREKSVLRAAAEDLLPQSVLQRIKSPYPSTQDPAYERALRDGLATVANDAAAPANALLNKSAVTGLLKRPIGQSSMQGNRIALDFTLGLDSWLNEYGVSLDI
jgi:asparagine synthase (glutamine-hydrolysing)